jgi:hypothetical protein
MPGFLADAREFVQSEHGKKAGRVAADGFKSIAPGAYGKANRVFQRVSKYVAPAAAFGTSAALAGSSAARLYAGDVSAIPTAIAGISGGIKSGKALVKQASGDIKDIKRAQGRKRKREANGGSEVGKGMGISGMAEKRQRIPSEQLARMTKGLRG